jgi:hypothetical protein
MTNDEALEYCRTLIGHFQAWLTDWEDTFVRSVYLQLRDGRKLTEKQAKTLDNIMERCARQYGRGNG